MANLCSKDSLVNQLKDAFSINGRLLNIESPIWMDSSTVSECAALEESIGGSMKLAEITGSKFLSQSLFRYDIERTHVLPEIRLLESRNSILKPMKTLNEFLW